MTSRRESGGCGAGLRPAKGAAQAMISRRELVVVGQVCDLPKELHQR